MAQSPDKRRKEGNFSPFVRNLAAWREPSGGCIPVIAGLQSFNPEPAATAVGRAGAASSLARVKRLVSRRQLRECTPPWLAG